MGVSIDVLCERLGLDQVIPKSEYERISKSPASLELRTNWYDTEWLASAKAIAPIVSERLAGAETVLELGFGTGFRLLYYALNHPETRFVAVDKEDEQVQMLEKRLKRLRIRNVQVELGDMHDLLGKYSVVLGIDCFSSGMPTIPVREYLRPEYLRFGNMVDASKSPAFFCASFYEIPQQVYWADETHKLISSIGQEAGLPRLETVPFSYVHSSGVHWSGRLMFMMPE